MRGHLWHPRRLGLVGTPPALRSERPWLQHMATQAGERAKEAKRTSIPFAGRFTSRRRVVHSNRVRRLHLHLSILPALSVSSYGLQHKLKRLKVLIKEIQGMKHVKTNETWREPTNLCTGSS